MVLDSGQNTVILEINPSDTKIKKRGLTLNAQGLVGREK